MKRQSEDVEKAQDQGSMHMGSKPTVPHTSWSSSPRTPATGHSSNGSLSSAATLNNDSDPEGLVGLDKFIEDNDDGSTVVSSSDEEHGLFKETARHHRHRHHQTSSSLSSFRLPARSSSPHRSQSPASAATKGRVAVIFLAATIAHEVILYKLTPSTGSSNSVLHLLPLSFLIVVVTSSALILVGRVRSSSRLSPLVQQHLGESLPLLPSRAWRDIAPLAFLILAHMVSSVVQSGRVTHSVASSVETYATSALVLLLPWLLSAQHIPESGPLRLCAVAIPLSYGLYLCGDVAPSSAGVASLATMVLGAAQLALAKRWFWTRETAPAKVMATYSPLLLLLSAVVLLPLAPWQHAGSLLPSQSPLWSAAFLFSSILQQYFTLDAVATFSSPISVGLLHLPKALLVELLLSGGRGEDASHPTRLFYLLTLLATIALACSAYEDITAEVAEVSEGDFDLKTGQSTATPALTVSNRVLPWLAAVAFAPFILWTAFGHPALAPLQHPLVSSLLPPPSTVDIVISYYDEHTDSVNGFIRELKQYDWIAAQEPRVILYLKNNESDAEAVRNETGADVVVPLLNRGREAGTYLQHIIRNYNSTRVVNPVLEQGSLGLADHTLFMQPHLAWDWIARERLRTYQNNTGYLHFAPYITMNCGEDMAGNGNFARYSELYAMFRGTICPTEPHQLGAYAAQFVVSKKRILQNPYDRYKALDDLLEADADHWIHREGSYWHYHGAPGPTNPYLGHVVERLWPIVFDCNNLTLADASVCGERSAPGGCQCLD